jgi:hypothetical protein
MKIPLQYAAIDFAYVWGEVILDTPDEDDGSPSIFEHLRRVNFPMDEAMRLIREMVEQDAPPEIPKEEIDLLLEQIKHPMWRTYVGAKLGMM